MKKILLLLAMMILGGGAAVYAASSSRPEISVGQPANFAEVKSRHGSLELIATADSPSPIRFMIYSITGQMVKSIEVAPGESAVVELPSGYFIVKTDKWSKRVVVK